MAFYKNLFLYYCSAQAILVYNIHFIQASNSSTVKDILPHSSVLSRLFYHFVEPVMRVIDKNDLVLNDYEESAVHKSIREKIEELRTVLQDNDVIDPKSIMMEDKDDTTIMELLPKTDERNKNIEDDSFKSNIKKYKKLREKINKALTKESVSTKTKNLVVKSLDGLIKTLFSSQCKWKRNLRAVKSDNPADIGMKWNEGLQKIKAVILNFINNRHNLRRNDDVVNTLEAFQTMFKSVTDDIDVISKKYRIICDFIPKEHNNYAVKYQDMNTNALRNNFYKRDPEEDRCQHVMICSNELKEFMITFYNSLNETVVSVLKTYIEMYTRDVNADNENENDVIISILDKITSSLEEGMTATFTKETQKLELDKAKNNQANIKLLSDYVMNTIKSIKHFAKKLLEEELLVLREKVFSVILDDLNVNLDVDLGNLEREFIKKICFIFRLCNGRYKGRRVGSNKEKSNMYLEIQVALDEDTPDLNRKSFNVVTTEKNTVSRFATLARNLTVTRTTLIKMSNN